MSTLHSDDRDAWKPIHRQTVEEPLEGWCAALGAAEARAVERQRLVLAQLDSGDWLGAEVNTSTTCAGGCEDVAGLTAATRRRSRVGLRAGGGAQKGRVQDTQAIQEPGVRPGGRRATELEVRVAAAQLADLERAGRQLLEPRCNRRRLGRSRSRSSRCARLRRQRRTQRLERQSARVARARAPFPLVAGLREAGDDALERQPAALRRLQRELARMSAIRP